MIARASRAVAAFACLALAAATAGCTGSSADREPHEQLSAATSTLKDALILSAVKARLTVDDPDSATHLGVGAAGGVVTLRGTVRDASTRARLVADARKVPDVTSVVDELRLDPHQARLGDQASDALLVARIEAAITAQLGVQDHLGVHAAGGTVTLDGSVGTAKTRAAAVATARDTSGVRNVVDRIRVAGP